MTNFDEMPFSAYKKCILCPRACGVDRTAGELGVCGAGARVKLARAALHDWEEPCISGAGGSGAVFFSGCALRCVYCQNRGIAAQALGAEVEDGRLAEIFLELQEQGADNINLITPGQFIPHIVSAVEAARAQGLVLPVVYNTGGYEKADSLKALEGIVDVYLPDFKYMDEKTARRYSNAADYADVAKAAIAEMVRQQPEVEFYEERTRDKAKRGRLMKKGVMVRHLLLPGQLYDARRILRYLYGTYGNRIYYSLMSQYTPLSQVKGYPELAKRVSVEAYDALVRYAKALGIQNGFTQERGVEKESFIPHFGCEGVLKHKN